MSPDEIKELMSNDVHTPTAKDDDINVGVGAAFYNPSQMQYDYTTPGYNDSGCDCCCGGCGVSAYDQYYN
jgi:hypothetical protein